MPADERQRYQSRIAQLITERDDALAIAAAESESARRLETELRRIRTAEREQHDRTAWT